MPRRRRARTFRPFHIPAEPVQVVGRPAGQVAAAAAQLDGAAGRRQQAERTDRPRGENPCVFAAAPLLHGDDHGIGPGGGSGQTAGHDDERLVRRRQEDAEDAPAGA